MTGSIWNKKGKQTDFIQVNTGIPRRRKRSQAEPLRSTSTSLFQVPSCSFSFSFVFYFLPFSRPLECCYPCLGTLCAGPICWSPYSNVLLTGGQGCRVVRHSFSSRCTRPWIYTPDHKTCSPKSQCEPFTVYWTYLILNEGYDWSQESI